MVVVYALETEYYVNLCSDEENMVMEPGQSNRRRMLRKEGRSLPSIRVCRHVTDRPQVS